MIYTGTGRNPESPVFFICGIFANRSEMKSQKFRDWEGIPNKLAHGWVNTRALLATLLKTG